MFRFISNSLLIRSEQCLYSPCANVRVIWWAMYRKQDIASKQIKIFRYYLFTQFVNESQWTLLARPDRLFWLSIVFNKNIGHPFILSYISASVQQQSDVNPILHWFHSHCASNKRHYSLETVMKRIASFSW